MTQDQQPEMCCSCRDAGIEREATCRLSVAENRPLCQECAEIIRQGIHDGTMGGNPELDGTWVEIRPL